MWRRGEPAGNSAIDRGPIEASCFLEKVPAERDITEDSPLRESRYPYRGRKLPIYTRRCCVL